MQKFFLLCAFALFCGGCKSTYSEKTLTTEPPPLLLATSRIYVAIPFDGSFKDKVALNSGKQTAQSLYVALTRYTKAVTLGKYPESAAEALESARKFNAEYLVYPNIVNWEDHSTEWSGIRDQLQLKIDVIELATSRLAYSREISATGKWMTEGGDTPGDLLDPPIEEFVNTLFRRVQKPSALW